MEMNQKDSGPIHPPAGNTLGMTLRQHYAGLAMQGELAAMVANDSNGQIGGLALGLEDKKLTMLTDHWFRIADAMVKAGEQA